MSGESESVSFSDRNKTWYPSHAYAILEKDIHKNLGIHKENIDDAF